MVSKRRDWVHVLLGLALTFFYPIRFFVFPQTGSYQAASRIGSAPVILPFLVLGTFWISAYLPSTNVRWLKVLRTSFLIALPIVSLVWYFRVYDPLDRDAGKRVASFVTAYSDDIEHVREQVVNAQQVSWRQDAEFGAPYIVLTCENTSELMPKDPNAMSVSSGWYDTVFGENLGRELRRLGQGPTAEVFPEFSCPWAYVVVYALQETGRQIKLDIGSVPEFRWCAVVYAVDLQAMTKTRLPGRISGSKAGKPLRGLGGGAKYLERLEGKKPRRRKIDAHIHRLVNR